MKQLIRLTFIVSMMFLVFQLTPNIKTTRKSEISRIESHGSAEMIQTPPEKEKAITEPQNKPEVKPEPPKPVAPPAPTPAPTPKPQPKPVVAGTCSMAYEYGWPANTAYAVCMAESSGIHTKANMNDNHGKCIGSYSLMQVACFWYPYYGYSSADFYNARVNMDIAYKIWQRQGGFQAWTTYTSGKYLKYL